ncbi:pentapeptide repeat-containing protein [Streptomyces sp. CFMR 7]|uniref:pentapeptide repeat-containing protein n=1 Tax=Streptomyces sp. CFMR 7 TaxID=1649184 RepID=UPI0011A1F84E|nr:pentapeptide repeat-containing protein [Streptomyces sp. CFMR 7]
MIIPFRRRPKQDGRHTPNLWPVWLVAPGALLLVGLVAYGLYHGAELLLASESTGKGKKPVPVQDVIKTTVTVLTLIGAVLAALYAYRKQLLDEGASHRADATQLTERYTKAAEQLGHEQAAVRLAGVYAMARLADDWPEQRQVCVDVLCAYLRMPYETDINEPGFRHGEREVRLTIIRIIRSHLQDPREGTTWCGRSLDFTGTTFDDGTDFSGVTFSGGRVDFSGVTFSGGRVDFRRARFSGGQVDFSRTRFSGGQVDFSRTRFSGGQVRFCAAWFSGGYVDFRRARFSGGRVDFSGVTFSSGGWVNFSGARFSDGRVDFSEARFSGGQVNFYEAEFSGGRVDFCSALIDRGRVDFSWARFSGSRVDFSGSGLCGGEVDFSHARFSDGQVHFDVGFSAGHVHFSRSQVWAAASIDWGPFPPVAVNQP